MYPFQARFFSFSSSLQSFVLILNELWAFINTNHFDVNSFSWTIRWTKLIIHNPIQQIRIQFFAYWLAQEYRKFTLLLISNLFQFFSSLLPFKEMPRFFEIFFVQKEKEKFHFLSFMLLYIIFHSLWIVDSIA